MCTLFRTHALTLKQFTFPFYIQNKFTYLSRTSDPFPEREVDQHKHTKHAERQRRLDGTHVVQTIGSMLLQYIASEGKFNDIGLHLVIYQKVIVDFMPRVGRFVSKEKVRENLMICIHVSFKLVTYE